MNLVKANFGVLLLGQDLYEDQILFLMLRQTQRGRTWRRQKISNHHQGVISGKSDARPIQSQPFNKKRETISKRTGSIEKIDDEYVRNGTAGIFCFIQPHIGECRRDHAWQISHNLSDLQKNLGLT